MTSNAITEAKAFIESIRNKRVPLLPQSDEFLLHIMYNDLIEGLWILLSSLDDLEPLTSKSGRPLDIKVWSSQRALVKIFKGRLDAKMKLWPRPKGNKEETVGVKLLQMLLSEVERRGVIANQLASLVVWHFEAEQQQQHAQENEDMEENGDEVEVVEGDFSEMAV